LIFLLLTVENIEYFLLEASIVVIRNEITQRRIEDLLAIGVTATNPQQNPGKRLAVVPV
jgi:hypothetical protein